MHIPVSNGIRPLAHAALAIALSLAPACSGSSENTSISAPPAKAKAQADSHSPESNLAKPPPVDEASGHDVKRPQLGQKYLQAGPLSYLEVITGSAEASDTLPMVIAIHGLGDKPESFSGLVDQISPPTRIIVPRGLDPYGGGYAWFTVRARDKDNRDKLVEEMKHAAQVVIQGLDQLEKTRPTSGKPIVTGFSQGGMLSFTLATQFPDRFRLAIPVGGALPEQLWPAKAPTGATPIVALHGEDDPAVVFSATKTAVDELSKRGFDAKIHSYPGVGHSIPKPMREDLHQLLTQAVTRQKSK